MVELYRGGGNAEDFKGWATERKILVSSRNPGCGDFDLRMVNIKTGVQNPVYSACFSSAAIDPETASLIYSITDYNNNNCSCSDQTPKQGVYLNTRERTIPRQLSKENLYDLKWLKDGIVFLAGTGSRWDKTYSSEGEQGELPGNTGNMSPTVSLANGLWAWTGENLVFEKGIWIGLPGEDLKNVFDQVAEWITWSPDGQYLYFGIEDGSTFRAKIPEFTPDYLGKIQGNSAAWIMP